MDEKTPLVRKDSYQERNAKSCMNTKILILLFSLINTFGLLIPGSAQTQYIYSYLKKIDHVNDTEIQTSLNQSKTAPNNCGNSSSSDEKIQSEASQWTWYLSLVEYGIAVPVIVFIGPLVDRIGRKPLLLYNAMFMFVSFVIKTICIYFDLNLFYFMIGSAVEGLAGCYYTFHLASLSILADTSTKGKDRTFLMALYDAVLGTGAFLSYVGTGYLIQLEGYLYPFVISTGIYLVFFVLIAITLEDTWVPPDEIEKYSCLNIPTQIYSLCTNTINIKHQLNYFLMHMLIFLFGMLPTGSFSSLRTIYTLGTPFCWSPEHIGWYSAGCDIVIFLFGTLILKIVHSFCKSVTDEWIVIWGCLSACTSYVLMGISKNDLMLYGATLASILRILPIPLLKGIMSRIVHKDKQGVLFSNIYLIEAVCSLGGSTLFNNIYQETVTIYSGMVFFLMSAFPAIAIVLMMYVICTRSPKVEEELTIENPEIQTDANQ